MAQIEIADVIKQIEDEIEIDFQGRGKAAIRATARLAGVSHVSLIKAFSGGNEASSNLGKKLMEQGYNKEDMLKWSKTGSIPEKATLIILEYYAMYAGRYATEVAKQALSYYRQKKSFDGFKAEKKNDNKLKPEDRVRQKLVQLLKESSNTQIEVPTAAGKIDIITDSEIIEVKIVSCWKSAIGQIIVYGSYYPIHQKRIHLFGRCNTRMKEVIQMHCDTLNIKLTWHK